MKTSIGVFGSISQKGTDFSVVTDREIRDMEYKLNTRARMVLDGYTPVEVLTRMLGDEGGALTT